MRLERKLTLAVLALFVPPTAVAGLILLLLYRRGLLDDPTSLLGAVLVGLGAMMAYLALVARGLGHSLVRTIEGLRHGAELIATVNPAHRLEVRTGDELQALGDEINRLADRLRDAREGLDEWVGGATRELRAETARLSAILDGLPDGVVVVNPQGQVTLANRAARDLLPNTGALVGQPVSDFVDRAAVAAHLDRLAGEPGGTARFPVSVAGGVTLDATMTRLVAVDGGMTGFILSLRHPDHGPPLGLEMPPSMRGEAEPGSAPLLGMGLRSGAAASLPGPVRPELYDFSLFEEMERQIGAAERDHRLDELAFVVFDTETTGLRPEAGDQVISLAGVRVKAGEVRRYEKFDALVHPGRPVPPESVSFHGITDGVLAGAPSLDVVLPAFLRFAGDAVLVGHEASFDLRFLAPQARRLGLPSLTARPILDTRLLSRSLHGPAEEHSLEAVARRLGVAVVGRHSALGDALTTAEVFVRLVVILRGRGVNTLGDALEAVRRARTPAI
jgi:DNA polymerase III epsilon subunit family exonuclease